MAVIEIVHFLSLNIFYLISLNHHDIICVITLLARVPSLIALIIWGLKRLVLHKISHLQFFFFLSVNRLEFVAIFVPLLFNLLLVLEFVRCSFELPNVIASNVVFFEALVVLFNRQRFLGQGKILGIAEVPMEIISHVLPRANVLTILSVLAKFLRNLCTFQAHSVTLDYYIIIITYVVPEFCWRKIRKSYRRFYFKIFFLKLDVFKQSVQKPHVPLRSAAQVL